MALMNAEDHGRAVKRTLDAVFRQVPGARDAFPALAAVHDKMAQRGLKALEDMPALDPVEVRMKLAGLLPNFGARQLEAITKVLTSIDRRAARRNAEARNLLSTPTMFAVEVPMEEFIDSLEWEIR